MQRYDREREPRQQRNRDVERSQSARSDYRNDDREDGMRAGYGEQDDWRESYTGYDQDEGYGSDFARQRYGRGYEPQFGSQDYQDERGGSRDTYGAGRPYGSASGYHGNPDYAGRRQSLYGEGSRGGDDRRYGPTVAPTHYPQQRGYGSQQSGYGREGGRYGQGGRSAWRDYDDSGQGYIGAYGSDLGYGSRGGRYEYGRGGEDRFYGDYAEGGRQYGYGNRMAQGRGGWYGDEREDAYGRNHGQGNYGQGGYGQDNYGQGGQDYRGQQGYGEGYGMSGYGQGRSESQGQSLRGRGPKNYMRSDERIKEDINERLTDDPMIDAGDINVEVKNGTVTLTGSVDSRRLKHRAEDIADDCGGVKGVENRLTVRNAGTGQNLSGASGGGSLSAGARSGTGSSGTSGSTGGTMDEAQKKH
ncbi:BON domain-containing protein [Tahibacter caeni]|uniref:BON domain-containing protein n=1 Tax=Tahibacter caeni TaxID=1453545 RepID=UPI00214957A3|nr:BON domain-containing protein [Tahibacter caeni]